MNKVTKPQLSKIHVLLTQQGLLEYKADYISQFTNGRETSSKEMTVGEAANLLKVLSQTDPNEKMRRKVFAQAYEAGYIFGHSWEDKRMNAAKLNRFILEKGTVKKELNKMTRAELIQTINQWDAIIKHNAATQAGKAAKSVLAELGIATTNTRAKKPI